MKAAAIFYFSGTGNTEIIAEMFKEELTGRGYQVDFIRIEDCLKNKQRINLSKYDLIGVGSQVIGFGAPKLVYDFIRVLPKGNGGRIFIFRTAGGVAPVNYNASKPMIRKLHKKGYDVFYERVFSISSNWVVRFDDSIVRKLYEAAGKKVSSACDEVLSGNRRIYKTDTATWLKMSFIRAISYPCFRIMGKDYSINPVCTKCELCVRTCPSGNIHMKNGKIKFGLNCNCCMRCLYSCPQKAINFRMLKFFRVQGEYNINKIITNQCDSKGVTNMRIPAFYESYINDDTK